MYHSLLSQPSPLVPDLLTSPHRSHSLTGRRGSNAINISFPFSSIPLTIVFTTNNLYLPQQMKSDFRKVCYLYTCRYDTTTNMCPPPPGRQSNELHGYTLILCSRPSETTLEPTPMNCWTPQASFTTPTGQALEEMCRRAPIMLSQVIRHFTRTLQRTPVYSSTQKYTHKINNVRKLFLSLSSIRKKNYIIWKKRICSID